MSGELHLVDWGTTNARSYRIGADYRVTDKRDTAVGIMNVADRNFAGAFDKLTRGWGDPSTARALLSGMVGSRNGWVEAPYASCPASLADVARAVVPHPEHSRIAFVPGLNCVNPAGRFDVMRGEEVQVFGALSLGQGGDRVLCLPGTHSKWVSCRDDAILTFATSMTGEAFDILRQHSILKLSMEPDASPGLDGDSFDRGVAAARFAGGLLDSRFGVRALDLSGDARPESMRDFLSGLLIGSEIDAMRNMFSAAGGVTVVGNANLNTRYIRALQGSGIVADAVASEDATIRGLISLSRRVSWRDGKAEG